MLLKYFLNYFFGPTNWLYLLFCNKLTFLEGSHLCLYNPYNCVSDKLNLRQSFSRSLTKLTLTFSWWIFLAVLKCFLVFTPSQIALRRSTHTLLKTSCVKITSWFFFIQNFIKVKQFSITIFYKMLRVCFDLRGTVCTTAFKQSLSEYIEICALAQQLTQGT